MDILPSLAADLREAQQLEAQRKRDPRVIGPLIQVYERIARQLQPDEDSMLYASVQNNLGLAYRDLQGDDHAANLAQAIACFQEALRVWTWDAAPYEYAMIQTHLGTVYSELSTGDRATNVAQAITCFQEALRVWTPETTPLNYALTQHNLGNAYSKLPTGDRATNAAQAITCFQEALRVWTPETTPLDYALAQSNLGNVYREMPTGDRGANLALAIACCQEALRFLTPETAPFWYASAQTNLGLACSELLTGDRATNLTLAITCFEEVLRVWTPETTPFDYAMTKSRLGDAYSDLLTGDHDSNLEQAIASYQEALHFLTPETAPFEYALAQNNLGLVYRSLRLGDHIANLAQAIACFQNALRIWTPETAPFMYAGTRNNLGNAYSDLPTGDRGVNLEQAIEHYQEALRFRTLKTAPFDYAMTQNNLGNAYSKLPTGDRATNVDQAITCFQEALRVWTPETAPSECRKANCNLADLYFFQGDWEAALHAYYAAMDAGESLYRAGLSTESKVAQVTENAVLYRRATFAAVRCGKTAEALLILERGKTRLLAEALRLRVARPVNVPDTVWSAFEHAGADVRAVQSEGMAVAGKKQDPVRAYAVREQATRAAIASLEAAIEQVRMYTPNFLRPMDLSTVQMLLPDERSVLVSFCITEQGIMGFVVYHNKEVQVKETSTFTKTELRRLLVEVDTHGRAVGGWLVDYAGFLPEHTQAALAAWQETIANTLAALGQHLLTPVLSTLPIGVERIIFLPSADLFLLPLHAAPLSGNDSERVCDRYKVSYAPSVEVLANARAKGAQEATPKLYAVINPQADPRLAFTLTEGETIVRLFARRQIDEGQAGTKQRVIKRMHGHTYVHFSCHGSYDWSEPTASGLDLADGRLTLAELQQEAVDLSAARLVTLSACETGISDVVQGSAEEYVGIPAGFLLAGAPCVVSSLWAVPDLSTSLLMERFYRNHLSGGMDFVAALHEAQAWVRELGAGEVAQYAEQCYRAAKQEEKVELFKLMRYYGSQARQNPALRPFAHPYYWAAFTVNGM